MLPAVGDSKGEPDTTPALSVKTLQYLHKIKEKETILGSRAEVVNVATDPELILGAC